LFGCFFNANLSGFGDNPYHRKVELGISIYILPFSEGFAKPSFNKVRANRY